MPAAFGLFRHGFLGLLLRANEQDGLAIGGELLHKLIGVVETRDGLLQVDDMDAIAVHKDEWLHFGVPAARLMPEVNARLEKLLH